jgi:hypothetical protein
MSGTAMLQLKTWHHDTHQQSNCFLWGPPRGYTTRSSWECQFVLKEPSGVALCWVVRPSRGIVLEFGGSRSACTRSWALAGRPCAEQYSLESAIRECSPWAVKVWGIALERRLQSWLWDKCQPERTRTMEHRSWGTHDVGSRYQATTSEDTAG